MRKIGENEDQRETLVALSVEEYGELLELGRIWDGRDAFGRDERTLAPALRAVRAWLAVQASLDNLAGVVEKLRQVMGVGEHS